MADAAAFPIGGMDFPIGGMDFPIGGMDMAPSNSDAATALQQAGNLPVGAQDVLNNAANQKNPGIAALQNNDPGMAAMQAGTQRQAAMAGSEMAEMAPLQQQMGSIINQPRPQIPNLRAEMMKAPQVQDLLKMQGEIKQSGKDWMLSAGLLGGLVGAFSRKHTTMAVKAFSAAVKGFKEGQNDVVKQNLEIFKDANAAAVENAKMLQQQYEDILNDRKLSIDEMQAQMQAVALKYHDPLMAQHTEDMDFFKMQALMLQRDKAASSVSQLNQTLTDQVEQIPYKKQDAILGAARAQGGLMAAIANQAQQVLDGKQPMPTASTRNPQNMAVINLVDKISEATGKPYDQSKYPAYQAARIKLAQSSVPPDIGKTQQSIAKVDSHLKTLEEAVTALNAGDIPRANSFAQALSKELGDSKIVSAQTAVSAVAQEFHRVYVPTGGVEDERASAASNISPSSSPAQMQAAIATMKELMAGQAKAIYLISETVKNGGDVAALNVPASYIEHVANLGPEAVSQEQAQGGNDSSDKVLTYVPGTGFQ